MVIKEKLEEIEKDKRPWVRVVRTIFIIVASLFLIGLFLSQTIEEEENIETPKYHVRVSNSIGGHSYYCEFYELEGSTYKLFNEDSTLTNEITITDGYVVEINLSE